jgi:hypothetical protein
MRLLVLCWAAAFCLCFPTSGRAQNTGRIECPRSEGYVYLYSSLTTMEVRATLQCGELVQITGRYDNNFSVRTPKGDTGYVPLASVVLLKDQPGTGLPAPASAPSSRERMFYDERPHASPAPAPTAPSGFTLLKNTPIRVKLLKTISSATVHVGEPVEFELLDDVFVEGVPVLTKSSKISGVIAEVEPKKRFGHGGRLAFTLTSVPLADGGKAPVRCYQEVSGSSNTSSDAVLPLASGKDAVILQDTEFTALVDADIALKRETFTTPKEAAPAAPEPHPQTPPPQH